MPAQPPSTTLHRPRPGSLLPWRPAFMAFGGNQVSGPTLTAFRLRAATLFDHAATGNRVEVGPGFRNRGLSIRMTGHGNLLRIGAGVTWGGVISVYGDGLLVTIGDRCDAKQVTIVARHAGVTVGADSLFATGVEIRSSDIHGIRDRASSDLLNPPAPVHLGRHVWVAGRVFIGKGVTVPDGCVLGAGSVITRPFEEPDCVIAGNPARIIRRGIVWTR
ncbi:acyltransferase [Falsiroseomonas selenitidurans]|uniref:Acyltransferase n=1 Tax=Falsiroseomonas selenitidurans TaxID=2716335 RepID=A0ABX1DZP1_9PROT|nr:acyltransferase [Falsiroseomonas selenitidurans]NKC30379.1 acyltransferase [Falsiroseomonas selenitidurans]